MAILVNFPPRPSLRLHRSGTFFCIVLNAVIMASGALAQCIDAESATASRVENACYEIYHPGCRPKRAFTPASGSACNALLQDKSLSSEEASQARLLLCLNPYYPPGYYQELQYRNCRDAIDGGNLSDKDLALAYTRRGEINFSPNKSEMFWDGNLRDLDKALKLDAESIRALLRRAAINQSFSGNRDLAIADYRRLLELQPANEYAKKELAKLEAAGGVPPAAPSVSVQAPTPLEKYYQANPDKECLSPVTDDIAIEACTRAIDSGVWSGDNILGRQNLGLIFKRRAKAYRATGQYDLAVADYNKAIQISPSDHWNYQLLAQLYLGTGDKPNAIAAFKRLLENSPGNPYAINQLRLLGAAP
jgi:tetratricopeptide (TPR) repeat protein